MLRSHDCGALNEAHINENVTLSGWVQRIRNKGFIIWVDLRDRYGLTQLVFCLLYTSPSPRDATLSRMPSSA